MKNKTRPVFTPVSFRWHPYHLLTATKVVARRSRKSKYLDRQMATKIRVFGLAANYTPLPNLIADSVYPALGPVTASVLGVILRQTIGWHRQTGDVSYETIRSGTGIKSNHTISKSLKVLLSVGLIRTTKTAGKTSEYTLEQGLEVETVDELLARIEATTSALNAQPTRLGSALNAQVPVHLMHKSPTTLPIKEKKENKRGLSPSGLSPEEIARARARKTPIPTGDPLADSLEQKPLRKIMQVAKRGAWADAAAALVLKYFEVTGQPIDTASINKSMHPARRLAALGATTKLVESAWEKSAQGKAFAVTSLFSLEGTIRQLMGDGSPEAIEAAPPAPPEGRRWDAKLKQFVAVGN